MNAQTKQRMKILLADDGSQHAQAAIKFLQDLPLTTECRVNVLRVLPPGQNSEVGEMESKLQQTKEKLLESGIIVETDLLFGHPAEKIIETASEKQPDIIVIGAKGLRATLNILLGGVAQQVVEYADRPVLVIRAPYHKLRRALLVTDGSSYSQHAVRYLGTFPLPNEVEVRLMHVLPPLAEPIVDEPYLGGRNAFVRTPEEEAKIKAKQEKEGNALLKRTRESLHKKGLESTPVLARGDAATEIIDYTDKNEIDLIVAGSRGLSSFQGWLMGSVSRKLVHYSHCSVLIVKKPDKK